MANHALIETDIEDYVIEEFIIEFGDLHDEIESLLLRLENEPNDKELLNNLFRHVHSIKGNLQIIGLDPIADFVHALENVLDKVRKHELIFDKLLSDVILLSMDNIQTLCEQTFAKQAVNLSLTQNVQRELCNIANHPQSEVTKYAERIIHQIDPNTVIQASPPLESNIGIKNTGLKKPTRYKHTPNKNAHHDLDFFAKLASSTEERSSYWKGRTDRLLDMARGLNETVNFAVDPMQLDAAVYLHDFGMAFLPLEILHKSAKLTAMEFEKVKQHPYASAEFIREIEGWNEAKKIILQHHEREDGSGYPKRVSGQNICDGAKIIAIANTFESMTQHRADRHHKRPLLRAITEINNCSGKQFSDQWVQIFNQFIRHKKCSRS
ncbi:MAG: HD domain-containing protein [Gammaproteobacteria bacterium]|nr:HD domain-containing protein [Gammaproteobacteria bacterium]